MAENQDSQQDSTPIKMRKTAKQTAFLESFAQHGIVTRACKDAGIDRTTVYVWKEHDERFLIRYNLAFEEAKDNIREEVRRRAHDGWDEPLVSAGKYVRDVRKYSDTLLIFHAKMLMAEYRDKQQVDINSQVTIHDDRNQVYANMTEAELDQLEALYRQAQERVQHGN